MKQRYRAALRRAPSGLNLGAEHLTELAEHAAERNRALVGRDFIAVLAPSRPSGHSVGAVATKLGDFVQSGGTGNFAAPFAAAHVSGLPGTKVTAAFGDLLD